MKQHIPFAILASVAIHLNAADISGTWKAEFETQIGVQKYAFILEKSGAIWAGTAQSEIGDQKRRSPLEEIQLKENKLSFVELLNFQGNDLRITYHGTVEGNEIQFTREVGDFATEKLVARLEPGSRPTPAPEANRRPRGGFGGPIELGPDDIQVYDDPPEGFNTPRDVPPGKLEMIEYDSKTVGTVRKMNVYTPPGYTADRKYPVLYLLHGIGGDETEWDRFATPNVLLDNLIADHKAVPMIIVMPNGRAQKNDRAEGNVFASAPAFAIFEKDLLDDVIPTIESRYSVDKRRTMRALAGLSMGGGQSLNFGLTHLDTFAWVGGFSSAPNTKAPDALVSDPETTKAQLKLLWLSCGNKDGLIRISQGMHAHLQKHAIPHTWNVDSYGHDATHWRNNLWHFVQKLFQ